MVSISEAQMKCKQTVENSIKSENVVPVSICKIQTPHKFRMKNKINNKTEITNKLGAHK